MYSINLQLKFYFTTIIYCIKTPGYRPVTILRIISLLWGRGNNLDAFIMSYFSELGFNGLVLPPDKDVNSYRHNTIVIYVLNPIVL